MPIKKSTKKAPPPAKKAKAPVKKEQAPRDSEGKVIPRLKVVFTGTGYQLAAIGLEGHTSVYIDKFDKRHIIKEIDFYRSRGFLVDDAAVKGK